MGKISSFIPGAAIGVAAALLLAPKTGEQTRALVTEKANSIVGEAKEVVDKKTGETNTVIEDPTDATIMKKTLDQVYDKVDIVVNFVGLPSSVADLKKITFLTRKNTATGKNNMLLMCDIGLPYVEQDMLKHSRVCAIIDCVSSAGENFDMQKDSAPKDLSDAFDLMYFFVNADTLGEYTSENPNYFITK